MANRKILILLALAAVSLTYAEVQLITKPEPGQEYVFLQTSAAGSRPVERKEKPTENERIFETAHKLPPSLTFALNHADDEEAAKAPKASVKNVKPKREALPADAPAPAPAGAIKLDIQKLLEQYKTELKTSTTTTTRKPATTSRRTGTRSTKRALRPGHKRTKKEAQTDESVVATTVASVLTTSAAGLRPIERDDDVPLVASGSEKQRSRIQIKKGPNGQEYEYEYVYYYYDDDDTLDKKDSKQSKTHDGPARNEITPKQSTPSRSRGVTPEPAANEVLPTSRARSRGRQLDDEDISEERLPANTRFPPRSRNLNTTPASGEETIEETKPSRPRSRGRPEASDAAATSSETDSVSDETQGSRGRTRANVRRPSSLVDSASFNTHTSSGEPPNGSGPSFPSDLPAGPVRFLGATPNERMDLPADKKESASGDEDSTDVDSKDEATTMMSAMDKVALDLYAILQGTQRLSGEQDVEDNTEITTETEPETTTLEATTEIPTTEATTPSTTTTTTTTTTQAPSTSAPEPAFGRGKYRTRPAIGGRKPIGSQATTTTSTEAPQEGSKPKSRFGRPSFGNRPNNRARTTAAPSENVETSEQKEEAKPVSSTRTRSRFGAARTRATTAAPSEGNSDSNAASPTPTKASLRPRPTFNLRGRTRPTPAPESESPATEEGQQEASTTARSRPRLNASNVRPLRPGPRINLTGGRGRLGVTTPAAESSAEPAPVVEEDQEKSSNVEEPSEKETEVTPAPDGTPLSRLRNRQRSPLQVRPAAPKAAASAPVQVRRVNPLISRRKPIGEASTTEAPAPEAPSTDASADAEEDATDAAAPSSTTSTTEEPKGLNKLLAGRRRLTLRQPGTIA